MPPLSPRGRLEKGLDPRVEISGNSVNRHTSVRSAEARHRMIGQMHFISALVDEESDRHGYCNVCNRLYGYRGPSLKNCSRVILLSLTV